MMYGTHYECIARMLTYLRALDTHHGYLLPSCLCELLVVFRNRNENRDLAVSYYDYLGFSVNLSVLKRHFLT